MSVQVSRTLKMALLVDAAATAGSALLALVGSGLVASLTNLPANLLFWAGAALVPFVIFVVMAARTPVLPKAVIWAIIGINLAWVAASLYVAFGPAFAPNLFGKVFVTAQAVAVALFAELQVLGLKRSVRTA
jgi:hypothetical protein